MKVIQLLAAGGLILAPTMGGLAAAQTPGQAPAVPNMTAPSMAAPEMAAPGTPSPMMTAPAASPPTPSVGYVLGPDDEVEVTVFGQPAMSTKARIRGDGTIAMPLVGTVRAAGRTTAQLSYDLAALYRSRGFLADPSISVEVGNYVSKAATVLGHVPNSGNYPLDRNYTVAMLIARAGGVRPDGANAVVLTRAGQTESQRISLIDPQGATSTFVQPGDTLFVPPAESVYVYGQVTQPGAFPYQPGMTYRQALARAGGPTLAGSTRKIQVRRGGELVAGVDLDDVVKPEDVLIIKEKLF